jgi:hypothetical protein
MLEAWGEPAAAIDVDQLYLNVDARWELPYDDRRNAMVLGQAAQLAVSLYEHGWPTVTICGNSLFEPRDTSVILKRLCGWAEIHHVTLAGSLDVLLRRSEGAAGRDLARLRRDFEIHAARPHTGTAMLDNTNLTAEQALSTLVEIVRSGAGRLHCLT